METRAKKRARVQHQGTADAAAHQPAAHDTAAGHEGGSQQPPGTEDPPTHLLSLPHHLIASLILPRVSEVPTAFLLTCKAAHSLSSTHLQADWLQRNRPATALYVAAKSVSGSEALMLDLLGRPGVLEACAAKDRHGDPLLVCTSRAGYSQAVRVLLQRGLDPQAADRCKLTPLMAAARDGHASVVETLLQADGINRVKVEQSDVYGYTALHWAASQGHANIVCLLLQANAPINACIHVSGFSPLHMACIHKRPAAVRELLQCADVNTALRDAYGETPLDFACKYRCDEIVALLEQHASRS